LAKLLECGDLSPLSAQSGNRHGCPGRTRRQRPEEGKRRWRGALQELREVGCGRVWRSFWSAAIYRRFPPSLETGMGALAAPGASALRKESAAGAAHSKSFARSDAVGFGEAFGVRRFIAAFRPVWKPAWVPWPHPAPAP